jgi:choice-of-anchor A domain-containing protein
VLKSPYQGLDRKQAEHICDRYPRDRRKRGVVMNRTVDAYHSHSGTGCRAYLWSYQCLVPMLILTIVLLLGSYSAVPAQAAVRGQSVDLAQPMLDQTQVLTSRLSSVAHDSGTPSSLASNRASNIPEALSTALAFNIFLLGDLEQRQSITYGRIAVGGNARLERYRIGDSLPRSRDNRADLIVGGTLIFTDGLVAKGNIVAGGKANIAKVGIPNGKLREGLPIDFGAQSAALSELATRLGQLAPNGSTQVRERSGDRKEIALVGTDRRINIFAVSGRDLASAQTLIVNVPNGATVLLNIDGAADQFQAIGFAIGKTNRQRILYNFYQATELTLDDDRIQGSILAPYARVTFVGGRLNGTLIGAALAGSGIAWPAPFNGQLPNEPI